MTARGATGRGLLWAAVLLVATVRVTWAQAPPEAIEYYARDAVGSVRIVFDTQGNVLGRSDYLPFGETWNQSGALPRQRFTGQARDGEAGLDDFNARAYQPLFGRFTRPDPVSGNVFAPQSWNAYAYVQNRPLVATDPSGMRPDEHWLREWPDAVQSFILFMLDYADQGSPWPQGRRRRPGPGRNKPCADCNTGEGDGDGDGDGDGGDSGDSGNGDGKGNGSDGQKKQEEEEKKDPCAPAAGGDWIHQTGSFVTGLADAVSFGIGPVIRNEIDGLSGVVDESGTAYQAGSWASLVVGYGRLTYAGSAKAASVLASSGTRASAIRTSLKAWFGLGLTKSIRVPNLAGKTDQMLRLSAGRTNPYVNAYGAGMAARGTVQVTKGCGG